MVRHALVLATAIVAAGPALAATINIVPGTVLTGQGIVSGRAGVTEENFNAPGTPTTCVREQTSVVRIGGLPEDSWNLVVGTKQDFGPGNTPYNLAPVNDGSCYLTLGRFAPVEVVPIEFDPSGSPQNPLYVGFYWGSIDEYNFIQAFNDANDVVPFLGFPTPQAAGAPSGADIAAAFGIPLYSSQYVELRFTVEDDIDRIEFTTFDYAFEIDNFAVSGSAVPLVGRVRLAGSYSLEDQAALGALRPLLTLDQVRAGVTPFQVAEPAPALLVLGGLALVAAARRRRAA